MKIFIIVILIGMLSFPLLGEQGPKKLAQVPKDSTIAPFVPLIPDSLMRDSLRVLLNPEKNSRFQYRMGILKGPDPYSVELNPGGIYKVDPTVDLGMIYPLETRQKLLLKKKTESEEKKKRLKRFEELYLKEKNKLPGDGKKDKDR